jgi:Cys/Met metabolism PLP-dependent enzyme
MSRGKVDNVVPNRRHKPPYIVRPPTAVLTRGFDPSLSVGSARPAVFRSSSYVFSSPENAERAFSITLGKAHAAEGERVDFDLCAAFTSQCRHSRRSDHTARTSGGDTDGLIEAIRQAKNLALILIETPANPTLRMSDIVAASEAAQAHIDRPLVVVDNTLMGPANKPIPDSAGPLQLSWKYWINPKSFRPFGDSLSVETLVRLGTGRAGRRGSNWGLS